MQDRADQLQQLLKVLPQANGDTECCIDTA